MQSNKSPTIHCVKVPRVLDWLTKSTVVKLKETVDLRKIKFDDLMCCDFCIPCGESEPTILWTTYGIRQIGGSFCIKFKRGCGNKLTVFVNGEKHSEVNEGSTFTATFTHLDSVEVQCNEGNLPDGNCYGEFKIVFHFHPNDERKLNSINDIKKTTCYVSDCHGNPISVGSGCVMKCKDLTFPEDRGSVRVANGLGKPILLQRIEILTQGFVCVQFINHNGDVCLKCIFPFSEVETVFICAPEGTDINCKVTDVDCRAHVIPSIYPDENSMEVVIILLICQSVQSVDEVIIGLDGAICNPRENLNAGC